MNKDMKLTPIERWTLEAILETHKSSDDYYGNKEHHYKRINNLLEKLRKMI